MAPSSMTLEHVSRLNQETFPHVKYTAPIFPPIKFMFAASVADNGVPLCFFPVKNYPRKILALAGVCALCATTVYR